VPAVKLPLLAGAIVVAALVVLALLAFAPGNGDDFDAAAAQEAARTWTGVELTDAPRRRENGWEVDVRSPDGSIVEVNLGPKLELVELDEEIGPGGTPAHDEVMGERRERAIAAARPRAGAGVVRSVERERDGTIEVDFVLPDRTVLEVDLDARLRITGADREELGDE
jgi:hypothetical protein